MVQIMTGLGEQLCVLTTKETPRQVLYGRTVVVLRSESARGVRIILIDPHKLFRIRIPKYALSFEAEYKKKVAKPC